MKYEYYEIPIDNLGNEMVTNYIKLLLNKLHTYQDFCAKEEVTIQIRSLPQLKPIKLTLV